MGFKLGSSRINPLKNKGFLNQSPFTSSGNTMAYIKDGEDPIDNTDGSVKPTTGGPEKKPKSTLQEQADLNAANAEKVLLKPGEKGYDETKEASYIQTGEAELETPFTEEGNLIYENKSQEERDIQDKKWKEIQNKNAEIFSYDDKTKEPDPGIEITTSETPRPKYKPKAQDYIAGEGDKVFAPPSKPRLQKLSKALTGKADSFGMKTITGKEVEKYQDAYDASVMASRAKQGKMGAESLTLAEQKAKGSDQINKKGAGRSSIVDTKSGEGLKKGEIAVKDSKGNMMYVNRKKGTSRPASPKNDIKTKIKKDKVVNASTIDGRDTTV
tara:strand:+ start:461 stop:1441 length:981 start_codon:yes stop_codon:yes gene_type:complete